MIKRSIPGRKENLPVIGTGTWQSFDVSPSSNLQHLKEVITLMHNAGARVIDSSPMYGQSEEVIGVVTGDTSFSNDFFYATKVWIQGEKEGKEQMKASMQKMKRYVVDLMQIHNLLDWQTHLHTLRLWKEKGIIRYIGITHYTDAMHDALIDVINKEPIDFVQFNYSIAARNAEKRLLPLAADKGVATLINRPFGEGAFFKKLNGKPLPEWCNEYGITTWSAFMLKFIISHPAVTCVIPATRNPAHMADNLAAGEGRLPGEKERNKMADYYNSL